MTVNRLRGLLVLVLLTGSGLLSAPACAGLIGSSLEWQYYGGGGPYNPGNGSVTNGTFTVNGGIGGTFFDQGAIAIFHILADDTSVTFDYTPDMAVGPWTQSPPSLAPTINNGIAITLLAGSSLVNVSIDPATNMTGFGNSNFSFTNNQIEVDWQNLPFASSTIVKLDVTAGDSGAPEPATGALTAASLLAAVVIRRRKRAR